MKRLLTTATGREIPDASAVPGRQYSHMLHIRTAALSFAEAAALFADPAETATLTYQDEDRRDVYEGYTTILSIELSPLSSKPGELLIRLAREEQT